MRKTGLVASGVVLVLAAGAMVFVSGAGQAQAPGQNPPPAARDAAQPPAGGVNVKTPQADISVDTERGKVRVRAPESNVAVDIDGGQVQVRAPHVNLDVRW